MVYPVDDRALVLVGNKGALLLVNVINQNTAEPRPSGKVTVLDKAGTVLATLDLTAPTDAKLPTTAPVKPSFATAYSAEIPARFIVPGVQFQIRLADRQLSQDVKPRVGSPNVIAIKGVRVVIIDSRTLVSTTAVDYPAAAEAIQLRSPVTATYSLRPAAYTSNTVKALPGDDDAWRIAMRSVLSEIADLRITDSGAFNEYFVGFVPKRTWGLAGMAYSPGRASVIADLETFPDRTVLNESVVHEVAHNVGLRHAPCGNPGGAVDLNYPYADALLGAGSRYIWGYEANTRRFVDPTTAGLHDLMSYCFGNTFSDYNYKVYQEKFNPADADIASFAKVAVGQPQEALLISGELELGVLSLKPLKRFVGIPTAPGTGAYTARITTASGDVVSYPFEASEVDHLPGVLQFSFSVPNPGDLSLVEILRNGQLLFSRAATASAQRARPGSTLAEQSRPQVTAAETGGQLRLRWDPSTYPYLTVAHIGTQRTTLSFDMQGGSGNVAVAGLPAGGSFEFVLSDGMNSIRILQPR